MITNENGATIPETVEEFQGLRENFEESGVYDDTMAKKLYRWSAQFLKREERVNLVEGFIKMIPDEVIDRYLAKQALREQLLPREEEAVVGW